MGTLRESATEKMEERDNRQSKADLSANQDEKAWWQKASVAVVLMLIVSVCATIQAWKTGLYPDWYTKHIEWVIYAIVVTLGGEKLEKLVPLIQEIKGTSKKETPVNINLNLDDATRGQNTSEQRSIQAESSAN